MSPVLFIATRGSRPAVAFVCLAPRRRGALRGASLVLVLVITAAMAVVVMVFAKVVRNEMRISRGYSNVLRADLAARAGAAEAESLLLGLFHDHPDSVTYWDPKMGATTTPGTVFMYRDRPPGLDAAKDEYVGTAATAPAIFARPLVSGATEQQFYPADNSAQALTAAQLDPAKSLDLNTVQTAAKTSPFNGAANGWIGKLPGKDAGGNAVPQAIQVPWVEVKDADGTVRARYAWWVDDESFKLNVNTAKAAARGTLAGETSGAGTGAAKTAPKPTFQGLFAPASGDPASLSQAVGSLRDKLAATGGRFLTTLQIAHVDPALVPNDTTAQTFGQDYKFYLTAVSSGLNLSRAGAKRLDLNKVVTNSDPASPTAAADIRAGLDRIIAAIKVQAPHFGERFYRVGAGITTMTNVKGLASSNGTTGKNALQVLPTTTQSTSAVPGPLKLTGVFPEDHREIYLTKIAANIHDYISASPNPTVVRTDRSIMIGVYPDAWAPASASDSGNVVFPGHNTADVDGALNPIAAVGKKAVPYLQEYVFHAYLKNLTPWSSDGGAASADYDVVFNYYFGFWNMTGKDINVAAGDLGVAPFIAVQDQPFVSADNNSGDLLGNQIDFKALSQFDIPSSGIAQDRDIEIPLDAKAVPGLVFKAGEFTVITTDPNYAADGANLGLSGKTVYVAPTIYKKRLSATATQGSPLADSTHPYEYVGKTTRISAGDPGDPFRINILGRTAHPGNIDYRTKVILGNQYGFLDGAPALHIDRGVAGNGDGSNPISINWDSGAGARGNPAFNFFRGSYLGSAGGDPRGKTEPLKYDYTGTSGFTPNLMDDNAGSAGAATVQANSSLGTFTTAQDPSKNFWQSDRSAKVANAANAPMTVARGPMTSIGELGNIFDPVRFGTTAIATSTTPADVYNQTSGGATLPVGQPDILWDGYGIARSTTNPEMKFQVSRSRGWTAWRLCDIFSILDDADARKADAFTQAGLEVDGLYNPNGILRDGGRTLRALVEGIAFSDDPGLAGTTFNTGGTEQILDEASRKSPRPSAMGTGGQALANYLAQRLTRTYPQNFSPLWERGELSQFYMFDPGDGTASNVNAGTDKLISAGVATSALNDRGREELFRRLADLVTTKGNTFSIYVVGQAMDKAGTTPISTKARRVLVRLHPVFSPAIDDTTLFDPQSVSDITARFRPPDAYRLEVLSVEEGTLTAPHAAPMNTNRFPKCSRREAFTLVEMLVVLAIASILMAIVVRAFQAPGLRQASANQMTQALDEARMTAIETGTRVYIGFADGSYPDESKRLCSYVLFREPTPGEAAAAAVPPDPNTFVALTSWQMLPKGFYIDDRAKSSLLQENKAQLADPKGLNIPAGTSVTLYVIVFDSLGQVVQPQGINPCLTVIAGRYTTLAGLVPAAPRDSSAYLAAAFSVEVSRLTGRMQYQNGLPPAN